MSDFYGIELRGKLFVPNANATVINEYELWTGNTITDSRVPQALVDLAYVQDISIQVGLSLNSKVTLTLTPPLDIGLELIHSPLLSWGSSRLEVQIGYSTGGPLGLSQTGNDLTLQAFGGIVTRPDVKIGQDTTITINALGVAYPLNVSHMTTTQTYPAGTSPWEAVSQTFSALGYDVSNEDAVFPDFRPDERDKSNPTTNAFFRAVSIGPKISIDSSGFGISVDDEYATINKGHKNDWWFVRQTIKDYGLDLLIIDRQIQIRDPQKWKATPPSYRFVLQGNLNTSNDTTEDRIYPILDFITPSAFVWLANGTGGLLQSDVSIDKKTELTKVISDIQPSTRPNLTPSQAANAVSPSQFITNGIASAKNWLNDATVKADAVPVTRTGTGSLNSNTTGMDAADIFPGSPEDQAADQAIGEYRNFQHSKGIQAEILSLGIPDLLPGIVIWVDGMAPPNTPPDNAWFDGNYGVWLVEHNIGTSGMTTKFRCLKNFIPAEMPVATANAAGLDNLHGPDAVQSSQDTTLVNSSYNPGEQSPGLGSAASTIPGNS